MIYRRGTQDDIPELVRMRIGYLIEHHDGLAEAHQDHLQRKLLSYFKSHLDKTIRAYIAVDTEPHVVSTTFLLITEKPARPSFMNGKTGTVLNVFTEKDYPRRGISEILMKMLMQDAHEEGLDYIDLTATEDGYPLYKKLGFAEEKPKTKPMKLTLRKPEL